MTSVDAARLQGIAAFVRTVEAGGFAAAGARMGLTRSAAAKAVARLEARLGVQLLVRTTRSVALTEAGRGYYEHCVRVLEELDAGEALMTAQRTRVSGTLRVSVPVSFGRLWVLPVLLDLDSAHPDLRLDLSFTDRYVDLIEDGIDLAVRIGEQGEGQALTARTLARQDSVLCAAPSYLERRGYPGGLDALQDHDCILFEARGSLLPAAAGADRSRAGSKPGTAGPVIGHGEAMLDAAVRGHGIARLPTWLAHAALARGALQVVLPGAAIAEQPIRAVWPHRRDRSPKLRAAVHALLARWRPVPPWAAHVQPASARGAHATASTPKGS